MNFSRYFQNLPKKKKYFFTYKGKSSKDIELMKKNKKKKKKKMIGLWYKLCESEEEFDNINEIEDSDDSRNENYHNIVKEKNAYYFRYWMRKWNKKCW